MSKSCECVGRMNEMLKPFNTRLALSFTFTPMGSAFPTIGTEQVERGRGKPRAKAVLPTFCPFCGTKYDHAPVEAEDRRVG